VQGAQPGKATGTMNIHALFKWKRNVIGEGDADPSDNPPPYLYVVERGTILTQENAYPYGDYSATHPFQGTQFSFTDVVNPLGGPLKFDWSKHLKVPLESIIHPKN